MKASDPNRRLLKTLNNSSTSALLEQFQRIAATGIFDSVQKALPPKTMEQYQQLSASMSDYIEKYYKPAQLGEAMALLNERINSTMQDIISNLQEYLKALENSNIQQVFNRISPVCLPISEASSCEISPAILKVASDYEGATRGLRRWADTLNEQFEDLNANQSLQLLSRISEDLIPDTYKSIPLDEIPFKKTDSIKVNTEDCKLIPSIKTPKSEYPLEEKPYFDSFQEVFPEFKDIPEEIINFRNHLALYPMLGFKSETGKIIYEKLEKLLTSDLNSPYFYLLKITDSLYRCRRWNEEKGRTIDYTIQNMFEAPVEKAGMARFNPPGVNHLYMTSTWRTAKRENRASRVRNC